MIKIATQTEQTLPAKSREVPVCPRCDSSEHVRKAGHGGRRTFRVQQFRCFSPECNGKWFLDPLRKFTPSGPKADMKAIGEAIALRRQGFNYREIGEQLGITKQRARYLCNYRAPLDKIDFCLTQEEKPKFATMLEHRRAAEPGRKISAGDFCHEIVSTAIARVDSMRRVRRHVDVWSIEAIER